VPKRNDSLRDSGVCALGHLQGNRFKNENSLTGDLDETDDADLWKSVLRGPPCGFSGKGRNLIVYSRINVG
jgi:hypothetical protein